MTEDKLNRRPLIDPLLLALKSRRVVVALTALLGGVLVLVFPELAAVRGEFLTLLIALALGVIGGYSVEDAARAGRTEAVASPEHIRELVKAVLTGLVDETADAWEEVEG